MRQCERGGWGGCEGDEEGGDSERVGGVRTVRR